MAGNYHRSVIITHTTLFIAMTTVFSWVSIPFIPVPITLQTMAVLLTGSIMKRYAGIPMAMYLLLGAIGLPVFHNGAAGLGVLIGPTGGYLVGFVPAAILVGLCYEQESEKIRWQDLVLQPGHLPLWSLLAGLFGPDEPGCCLYHRNAPFYTGRHNQGHGSISNHQANPALYSTVFCR